MNAFDLTSLYRNSIGFDRMASVLDRVLASDSSATRYPPYNITKLGENKYSITLALPGFTHSDLDINVEKAVLTIQGRKTAENEIQYLHRGISDGEFELAFNLDDHVEVTGADLDHGLLTITLVKELPEAMKPRRISIKRRDNVLEGETGKREVA